MNTMKKILINIMAVLMLVVCCFGMSACQEDITQIKLNLSVYNYDDNEEGVDIGFENTTLTVDLYGHFAPKTVAAVLKYVKDGYYNNTVFYKIDSSFPNQIMLGDLKADGAGIKAQESIMPQISGEFEHGGVSGSNLTAKKGSIGLWRTWYEYDGSYNKSNATMHSGRATWFMPTNELETTLSGYNGWFCIFAQMDMENEANVKAFELIKDSLTSSNIEKYVVYYTGEYDAEQPDNNHGLTQHIVPADDFNVAEVADLFIPKGTQEVCYKHYTVNIPVVEINGQTQIAARVVSAAVAK